MDLDKLTASLHPLERKVLPFLKTHSAPADLERESKLSSVEVMRALQWLENKGAITLAVQPKEVASLDANGTAYLKQGLPERRMLEALAKTALSLPKLEQEAKLSKQELGAALGVLRQRLAINVGNEVSLTDPGRKWLAKKFPEELLLTKLPCEATTLVDEERLALDNLRKRSGIIAVQQKNVRTATLTELGKKLASQKLSTDAIDRITPLILKSGEWRSKEYRRYDVAINVPRVHGARRHFVNQAREYIKQVWLDLGFKEMYGPMVQTAFWNMDALFVPQDHPSRDLQDTFYLKEPNEGKLPKALLERVRKTHETGWTTGSSGWGGCYSDAVAKENMLRTHTTVLSAQAIAALKKEDLPAKFFSVHKCFRNEALDWKHLFELTQVEGIVVDPDANFKNLKGYLKEFFRKLGFPDVRIRPGYFPYTEPSAEVDVWHPGKQRWMELGGSGIFRPEVTKPLLGTEVPVLAWGLGLERSIMEYYNITDVRELYKNDLKQLREIKVWMR